MMEIDLNNLDSFVRKELDEETTVHTYYKSYAGRREWFYKLGNKALTNAGL